MRSWWRELLSMCFYYSEEIGYFYAWSYKNARKKITMGALYVVNDYGDKCPCGDKFTPQNREVTAKS